MASGPGMAGVGATSMGDLALARGATMEVGGPLPGAEHIAVATVTVTPLEAEVASLVAHVPSMGLDVASLVADAPSMAVHVASLVADAPSMAVHVASVAADVPPVAADVASAEVDIPSVEAEAEAATVEAVPTVVGADRFRHNSKLSRPTAFAVGRLVGRRYRLRLRERI